MSSQKDYLEQLVQFNEHAERLMNKSFVLQLFSQKIGVTLSASQGNPLKIKINSPEEESIEAFILTLRLFIQKSEKSSFPQMEEAYENLQISNYHKTQFQRARKSLNETEEPDKRFTPRHINHSASPNRLSLV